MCGINPTESYTNHTYEDVMEDIKILPYVK